MRASIVVPTYRRPELLQRCLEAAISQRFPADDYEVVVADDAADPQTREQVKRLSRRSAQHGGPAIRYTPVTHSTGPAGARNAGARTAIGAVLAFTDDDTIPDSEWLASGVEAIDTGADVATGSTVVPLPDSRPTDYEREVARLAEAEFVTANCFVRSEVFSELGGFDERFTRAWREDSDLHFRVIDHGYTLTRAPTAIVVHPVRPAGWGVSLRQQSKSQDNALLYKKHPGHYRDRIQPLPPISYYAASAGIVGFAGARSRHLSFAATSLALWLAVTLRFIVRRLRGTSKAPGHVAEMIVTSILIPPLSLFWRLRGAVRHRVFFF